MNQVKAHWKVLAVILALVLWAAWYSRPVDVYGLGIGELEAVNVRISRNEPGVGEQEARSIGLRPGDPLWQTVLDELEALRFRRPPWNLVRQYQDGVIRTEPAAREALVFYLWDSGDKDLMLQLNGGKPCYTSPYTKQNLPASLSGGEETAQSLAERLRPLLEAG